MDSCTAALLRAEIKRHRALADIMRDPALCRDHLRVALVLELAAEIIDTLEEVNGDEDGLDH